MKGALQEWLVLAFEQFHCFIVLYDNLQSIKSVAYNIISCMTSTMSNEKDEDVGLLCWEIFLLLESRVWLAGTTADDNLPASYFEILSICKSSTNMIIGWLYGGKMTP